MVITNVITPCGSHRNERERNRSQDTAEILESLHNKLEESVSLKTQRQVMKLLDISSHKTIKPNRQLRDTPASLHPSFVFCRVTTLEQHPAANYFAMYLYAFFLVISSSKQLKDAPVSVLAYTKPFFQTRVFPSSEQQLAKMASNESTESKLFHVRKCLREICMMWREMCYIRTSSQARYYVINSCESATNLLPKSNSSPISNPYHSDPKSSFNSAVRLKNIQCLLSFLSHLKSLRSIQVHTVMTCRLTALQIGSSLSDFLLTRVEFFYR